MVDFQGYYNKNGKLGVFCAEIVNGADCGAELCLNTLENNLKFVVRREIMNAYKRKNTCEELTCRNQSSILTLSGNCDLSKGSIDNKRCNGRRIYDYPCYTLLNNIKYLRSQFQEPQKIDTEWKSKIIGEKENNVDHVSHMKHFEV